MAGYRENEAKDKLSSNRRRADPDNIRLVGG
jgi:hypothetical protein